MSSAAVRKPAAVLSPPLGFAAHDTTFRRQTDGGTDATLYATHPYGVYGRNHLNGYSEFVDQCNPADRADPDKNALLGACTDVVHLTRYVGTELHGIQLAHLTDRQKDELRLLIAERSVVFFRDQDMSPESFLLLGEWYREMEGHPQVAQVPGVPGVTVIGPDFQIQEARCSDLMDQPLSLVHLNDSVTVPDSGYDTIGANCSTNDKLRFKWTPGTSALWDNRVLTWMTQY